MGKVAQLATNTDPEQIKQEIFEQIEARFPEWQPNPGNLETWQSEAYARLIAIVLQLVAEMGNAALKKFGETIANVPPILAAPASVTSTWTMVDAEGHEIPAGTLVRIITSGDEPPLAFEVVDEVAVPAEAAETGVGEVLLQAVIPGEGGNGLSGDPELESALAFVDSIKAEGVTAGGVDAEDEDAYLERLVDELQLLSLSLIVPRDVEIDARAVAGVARALCVPGYDAEAEEEDVPLAFTVFPVDEDGAALSAPVKEELQERQAAKVPSGVVNYVADPTFTTIDVAVEATAMPGYDPAAVKAAVEARLGDYLSPARWGIPAFGDASNSAGWKNADTVYLNELIAEVDRVLGVGRVKSLTLAKGGGEQEAKDVALSGPAPLTEPGSLTVAVT